MTRRTEMLKRTWPGAVLLLAMLGWAGSAGATLLGDPIGFPQIAFDNQGTTDYDAVNAHFSIDATPLAIRLSPGGTPFPIFPDGGNVFLEIDVEVDSTGTLTGHIVTPDLRLVGNVDLGVNGMYSGTLLTANAIAFGFEDSGGSTDFYDFRFQVVGGLLNAFFASPLVVHVTSENSTFTGSFATDFGGEAKGTLGPIPEPGSALLLGAGTLGLLAAARRANGTKPRERSR